MIGWVACGIFTAIAVALFLYPVCWWKSTNPDDWATPIACFFFAGVFALIAIVIALVKWIVGG